MPTFYPVLDNATGQSSQVFYSASGNISPSTPVGMCPFSFNGALYMLVQQQGPGPLYGPYRMMQSTDLGATWTELDAASAPQTYVGQNSAGVFVDLGLGKVTVMVLTTAPLNPYIWNFVELLI